MVFEDITPEIITHYEQVTYKEITAENRLLHSLSKEDKKEGLLQSLQCREKILQRKRKTY